MYTELLIWMRLNVIGAVRYTQTIKILGNIGTLNVVLNGVQLDAVIARISIIMKRTAR